MVIVGTTLKKESSKLVRKSEKSNSGADVGPTSASENSGGYSARSGEIPSSRQKQRLGHSERSAPVKGSDSPYVHRVYKIAGDP